MKDMLKVDCVEFASCAPKLSSVEFTSCAPKLSSQELSTYDRRRKRDNRDWEDMTGVNHWGPTTVCNETVNVNRSAGAPDIITSSAEESKSAWEKNPVDETTLEESTIESPDRLPPTVLQPTDKDDDSGEAVHPRPTKVRSSDDDVIYTSSMLQLLQKKPVKPESSSNSINGGVLDSTIQITDSSDADIVKFLGVSNSNPVQHNVSDSNAGEMSPKK